MQGKTGFEENRVGTLFIRIRTVCMEYPRHSWSEEKPVSALGERVYQTSEQIWECRITRLGRCLFSPGHQ